MNKIFDVIVIGGALSGPRTAQLIAERGKSVLMIEDNKKIGLPCKCTGLISWRIKELLPNLPKRLVRNVVRKARFYSPNGSSVTVASRKPVYVLDRPGLDRYLFETAVKSGVSVRTGEKFLSYEIRKDHVVVKTDLGSYRSRILIGADGANSAVGRAAGLIYPKEFLAGVQTTADGNFKDVELWFGSKVCPGFFAWVVPENKNIARIGLAAERNASKYYEEFLKMRIGKVVKPDVGGIIRTGMMERTSDERVMVVGDAACQVKPYSGGGIVLGLTAAEICADAAVRALGENQYSRKFFVENYDRIWKAKIGPAILRGNRLRNLLKSKDATMNTMMIVGKVGSRVLNKLDMDMINYFA